jgi:hypothetical protein
MASLLTITKLFCNPYKGNKRDSGHCFRLIEFNYTELYTQDE